MSAATYDDILTALCIWREARGESRDAKRGVLWVIRNRVADKRWPNTPSEVILQRAQFSSFTLGDPNAALFPHAKDAPWLDCCSVVDDPGDDPTGGANCYHSGPPPKWAQNKSQTAQIGAFRFYRL